MLRIEPGLSGSDIVKYYGIIIEMPECDEILL